VDCGVQLPVLQERAIISRRRAIAEGRAPRLVGVASRNETPWALSDRSPFRLSPT